MGRLPKIRVNFDADVQYLLRLKHAVEEDKAYDSGFRESVCGKIVELQRLLVNAPTRKEPSESKAEKKARREK